MAGRQEREKRDPKQVHIGSWSLSCGRASSVPCLRGGRLRCARRRQRVGRPPEPETAAAAGTVCAPVRGEERIGFRCRYCGEHSVHGGSGLQHEGWDSLPIKCRSLSNLCWIADHRWKTRQWKRKLEFRSVCSPDGKPDLPEALADGRRPEGQLAEGGR